ncbi:hypothetical protein Tco_1334861 [Tanacetum coccineum]
MNEVQTTAEINIFATGQQHTEQPEFNNEGEVDQNAEQCHDTCPLPAKLTDNQTTELSNQSLESENILGLKWIPTGTIFTSSTTKVDSEPTHGLNDDITNQYECKQTLDVSACTLNIHADGNPALASIKQALSRIHKDGDGDALFQLKSDSLPHAYAQTTKIYYKHRDSRIMKAQELKTKTSAQTLIYKIFLQRYQVYQGILLASFQDDAKYEHVGQDTRSQGGKDDQAGRIKI